MAMERALEGIRVLDLTNVLSGPFCSYQLALQGAEVIKVEMPGSGDLARQLGVDPQLNARFMGSSFLAQNAAKKSLTLNLKHAEGRAVFLDLVERADVVLENFRPGVMERLGLGYETLKARRGDLVYCAISGFGQDGPMRASPAYDQIVQGLSGLMSITGDETSAPLRAGFPIADTMGGITAAFAIASALAGRARTGEGAFVDVSMLEATLTALGWAVSNYLIGGEAPRAMGNENATAAPSGTFRARDKPINIAANKQEQFEALCALIGRPDLAGEPRYADRESRKLHREALRADIEAALAEEDAAVWEARFAAAGIPAGRVLSVPEVLTEPQVAERGMVRRLDEVPGVDRPVSVLRAGFRVNGRADHSPATPPPVLGAHTEEILGELGLDAERIAALRAAGAV